MSIAGVRSSAPASNKVTNTDYIELLFILPDAPYNGRVLFDTTRGRYYCYADSNPECSYVWVWMRGDGARTLMSRDRSVLLT